MKHRERLSSRGPRASGGLRIAIAFVFLLSIGVRVVWVLAVQSPADAVHSDMAGYVKRAAHLAATIAGERTRTPDLVLWPYGTHYLLAAPLALDGGAVAEVVARPGEWMARNTPHFTIALQVALSAGSVLLITLLAARMFRDRIWPIVAVGVVVSVWPPTVSFVGFFLSEVPFTFFMLLSLWAWCRYVEDRPDGGAAWLAGVATAVAFTIRAQISLTAILGVAWVFTARHRIRGFRWLDVAGLVLPLLAVILFSALRFHDITGRWALVSDNVAISRFFAMTDYSAVRNDLGHSIRPASRTARLGFTEPFTVPGRIADAEPLDAERRRVWGGKSTREKLSTLLRNVRLLAWGSDLWPERNAVRYAIQRATPPGGVLDPEERDAIRERHEWRRPVQAWAARVLQWAVLPLACVGMLTLTRRRDAVLELGALHVATLVCTAVLYFAEVRYRAAYDPILVLFAVQALVGVRDFRTHVSEARARPAMGIASMRRERPMPGSRWRHPRFIVAGLLAGAVALGVLARCVEPVPSAPRGPRGFGLPEAHRSVLAPLVYEPTAADRRFLDELRARLAAGAPISPDDEALRGLFEATSFPRRFTTAAVTVYERGRGRMLLVRRGRGWGALAKTLDRVRHHPRYEQFDFEDGERNRIQIDFVADPPKPVEVGRLELGVEGDARFEPGVDGFRLQHAGDVYYFLPGDAFVRSVQEGAHLRSYLGRMVAPADLDRVEVRRFVSETYLSSGTTWLRLYRGIPVRAPVRKADLEETVDRALRHVIGNMREDGTFMYYYDAARDSHRDREHPGRDPRTNPYYNILRHGGGTLLLLQHYERRRDPETLAAAVRAMDFVVARVRSYSLSDGREAAYVHYNAKGKLGGSGIALVVLAEYERLTGDGRYRPWATRLANHVLAEMDDSGEFRYYHVYLDRPVAWESNHEYFNFYYPGEAVLGLAKYYNVLASAAERPALREALKRALRFLIDVRPSLHAEHYRSLPSDSWLMMGVDEMWDAPDLRDSRYAAFVLADGDAMVEHMYTREDALYPDYAGSFYYEYGNYPYADGARAEGLLAAFELAVKIGDADRVQKYGDALSRLATATMRLVNTPESLYFADRPELAVGGIRFKHTRQWFRIDTTQHVASFYLKLLPSWAEIGD